MLQTDALGVGFLFEEEGKDMSPSPRVFLLFVCFPSPKHPFLGELGLWGKPGILGRGVSWPGPRTCWHGRAAAARAHPTGWAVLGPAATRLVRGEPCWIHNEAFESQRLCYKIRRRLIEGECGAIHRVLANASLVTYINSHAYMCA